MHINDQQSFGYSLPRALTEGDRDALAKLLSHLLKSDRPKMDIAASDDRAALAKQYYDHRRRREQFLPPSLMGEPAWDILLILYWAQKVQQRMSVSSVAATAAAPQTTALRHIDHLCSSGIIAREKHPTDRRMSWLSLTEAAEGKMDGYFDWVLQSRQR
jgi:DNA-binding MarR family transcriptional regulator